MKTRHNKKRNTAFVYEALIREATVAIMKGDTERRDKTISVIKKHFNSDSLLSEDLECYRSLYSNQGIEQEMGERLIKEVRLAKRLIDTQGLFNQQTELINDINKELSSDIFNNFVPNYKSLATIDQIFSLKTTPKTRVMLEQNIIQQMSKSTPNAEQAQIDALTYKSFVKKFNEKYDDALLSEQKELLNHYISSFADNALELKIFLNKEIKRLKTKLTEACKNSEIKDDNDMVQKTEQIISRLDSFSRQTINENVLMTVLATQALVGEIDNGDND